jgi:cyclopropane fatty-acyl-phospholipid synthase-like methyltransferase
MAQRHGQEADALALGKLRLQPGMTLLDLGCGWGGTARLRGTPQQA